MKLATYIILLLATIVVAGLFAMRFSDGPLGPIPGGQLTTGQLVTETQINWDKVLGARSVETIELQLISPLSSRSVGAFAYNGELFVPVDLGFVWRRLPDPATRFLLRLIWTFKHWHQDALVDGRVVLRVDGKRYEREALLVTDEKLKADFRERVSTAAEQFFGHMLDIDTDPQDIWFFRMDPRLLGNSKQGIVE